MGPGPQSLCRGLRRSAEKRYGGARAGAAEVEAYLKSLHLEDLALACACGEGLEAAWEFFIKHFRQELRAAARAILRASGAGDETRAEELADSLYAELYGVSPTGSGRRKSLFEYFHGRSKLSTWLRAVLAQRHVDLLRTSWRTVSLETEEGEAPYKLSAGSPSELRGKNGARIRWRGARIPSRPIRTARGISPGSMVRSRLPSVGWRRANACSWRAITWTNSPWRRSDAH